MQLEIGQLLSLPALAATKILCKDRGSEVTCSVANSRKKFKIQGQVLIRGGVKLEFVRNLFDSIRKGKKNSKNSIIFNSKFVRFERKKFEKFANISNSIFQFEIFETLFLQNRILCCTILSFVSQRKCFQPFWMFLKQVNASRLSCVVEGCLSSKGILF